MIWAGQLFSISKEAFFVWCIQWSLLAFCALSFHSETTQHSSSAFDLPLQCALCRERRGIYKEQASGSGSAEGQRSLIRFPWTVRHFHPVAFSFSFFLGLHKDERDVQSMCLPACQSEFYSWQMRGFLVMCCTWFSTLPWEGLRKAKELGGKTHWNEKEWHSRGWQEEEVVRSVVKRSRKGRREEVTG